MSEYYNAKRTKNLYKPGDSSPFKLSRSKIELFLECPKCFYLDRRLGTNRPPGFPFNLNSAVDALLKKEFDLYRERGEKHPLIGKNSIDAIPVKHDELELWRNNFKGIQYLHEPTNLILFGSIDDLWISGDGEYIVVDYKATSNKEEITDLDKDWQVSYKRQMEIYQWLLRKNGHKVSDTGYFVYCNANTDLEMFNNKLEFDINLIPYKGNDSWIETTVSEIYKCLTHDSAPLSSEDCDYCAYREALKDI